MGVIGQVLYGNARPTQTLGRLEIGLDGAVLQFFTGLACLNRLRASNDSMAG